MQQNIGTVDRYLRLTSGVLILAGGLQMRHSSLGKSALLTLGALKIAEGVTGWCPMLYAAGVKNLEESSQAELHPHPQGSARQSHGRAEEEHNPDINRSQQQQTGQHSSHKQSTHSEENKARTPMNTKEHINSRKHGESLDEADRDILYS